MKTVVNRTLSEVAHRPHNAVATTLHHEP